MPNRVITPGEANRTSPAVGLAATAVDVPARSRAKRILPPSQQQLAGAAPQISWPVQDLDDYGAHPTAVPHITTVVVADRQRWVAEALRGLLVEEGFQVQAVATTTADLEHAVMVSCPDVVLVDLGLPDVGALEAGGQLVHRCPDVQVVALAPGEDEAADRAARRAGLAGCLSKQMSPPQLLRAIKQMVAGDEVAGHRATAPRPRRRVPRLTARELEILRLLGEGASGRAIAATLGISQHTVRTHVQHILSKLNASTRIQAVAYATGWGLLAPPETYGDPGNDASGVRNRDSA